MRRHYFVLHFSVRSLLKNDTQGIWGLEKGKPIVIQWGKIKIQQIVYDPKCFALHISAVIFSMLLRLVQILVRKLLEKIYFPRSV